MWRIAEVEPGAFMVSCPSLSRDLVVLTDSLDAHARAEIRTQLKARVLAESFRLDLMDRRWLHQC